MLSCGWAQRVVFSFKQKTAYEVRISDWSADVCSSALLGLALIAEDEERRCLSGRNRSRKLDPGLASIVERPERPPCRPVSGNLVIEVQLRDVDGGGDRPGRLRLHALACQREQFVLRIGPAHSRHRGRRRASQLYMIDAPEIGRANV